MPHLHIRLTKTSYFSTRYGFTLAEVLITLAIIGVVVALTIPTLINNSQEQEYKTAYKKAYSSISQAFEKASNDGDIVAMTGAYSSFGFEANFAAIKNQFIVSKDCQATAEDLKKCWNPSGEQWRAEFNATPSFIDNSGMAWRTRIIDTSGIAPVILVDTNGDKNPNQYGKDRFPFMLVRTNGSWPTYTIADMGIPLKVMPLEDMVNALNTDYPSMCPSYLTHPCYYTSWLFGGN